MKQNMGRTALMLSGGGAQAMYHVGTVRALLESKLYKDISVISGTSGGSITAAMCALKNDEELLRDVCIPTVSTDFRLNGEMKKHNIRWFPSLMEMGAYWVKHKLLMDQAEMKRCCDYYYGDFTFQEALKKRENTFASRSSGAGSAQRLLLNHISTPHVTLASAVAASCSLPGLMAPSTLITKDTNGNLEPFVVDGMEWIDGSVQADLPFKRISTLFNVSNYIVCQTNFHLVPFVHKAHHPSRRSLYWRFFETLEWDIRNRALSLSRLGLFPKIYGQDISKVFQQKYHEKLTLVPRFTTMQTFGLKTLANPTVKDMEQYLQNGQSAAWPYCGAIREMLRLESALDHVLGRLEERLYGLTIGSDLDVHHYMLDVDSMTSSADLPPRSVRFANGETMALKAKITSLESENDYLRKQLLQFRKGRGGNPNNCFWPNNNNIMNHINHNNNNDDNDNMDDQDESPTAKTNSTTPSSPAAVGERFVWSLVKRRRRSSQNGLER
eukprot:CAMPEP_0118685032 /NCGR_PEP_ID=MMETSP0800-20121206/6998_1 /TAXON_ID=210618 ORGANISM="Striatella unipunctata, Strain CCMP2910" /NCGR_SAMPLE_ID=MMETSP0800 /ASSEMBLY_ACC=CAM_ASM_000638 /LENGTH=496 /DNA_ID=CAMNT_0006581853 /DNA_START=35 /DNA_END=1526 /DNA_ORIENTATION=-